MLEASIHPVSKNVQGSTLHHSTVIKIHVSANQIQTQRPCRSPVPSMHVDGLVPSSSRDQEILAIRHQPMTMIKSAALHDNTLLYYFFFSPFTSVHFCWRMMSFQRRDGMRLGFVPCPRHIVASARNVPRVVFLFIDFPTRIRIVSAGARGGAECSCKS